MKLCTADGCSRKMLARGLCPRHYSRARRRGATYPPPPTVEERFWVKVDKSQECWLWKGARIPLGYGQFRLAGATRLAHRVAYELTRGPIEPGLVLDHLCRNPSCVNPAHLEAVTQRENVLRGESPMAKQARQVTCLKGHPLTREPSGKRRCRVCYRAWRKARDLKLAAEHLRTELDDDDRLRAWMGGGS